jgi:hypothetical protein
MSNPTGRNNQPQPRRIGRSAWAIAAVVSGVSACIPLLGLFFGILGLAAGSVALYRRRWNPELSNKEWVVFGMTVGSIGTIANAVLWMDFLVRAYQINMGKRPTGLHW